MRLIFLTILISISSAFAGLDRLTIDNLNLNYNTPYGKGDVEKIGIGFSTKTVGPYVVEIFRNETNLELKSPILDAKWNDPWGFFHDAQHVSLTGGFASIGKKDHAANVNTLGFTPKDQGAFTLEKLAVKCLGASRGFRLESRLMDDCHESLDLKVESLNVPVDFFMNQIIAELEAQEPMKDSDRPLDNLVLKVTKGDFALQVYTRVVFYAGLRAWGNVSYEDKYKAVVVRIDQIKFGYLPITSIVMKELRKRLKHPDVTITGNTIRIETHYETQP